MDSHEFQREVEALGREIDDRRKARGDAGPLPSFMNVLTERIILLTDKVNRIESYLQSQDEKYGEIAESNLTITQHEQEDRG